MTTKKSTKKKISVKKDALTPLSAAKILIATLAWTPGCECSRCTAVRAVANWLRKQGNVVKK